MKISYIIWVSILSMAAYIAAVASGHLELTSEVVLFFGLAISCYVGGDQLAGVLKTRSMPAGERFSGNRKKLLRITIATLALAMEAAVLELIFDAGLPVAGLFSIYLSGTALLAGGEKGKTALEGEANLLGHEERFGGKS